MSHGPICKTHNQPLTEYYCDNKTCQKQLCVTCIVVEHKDHELFSILKRKEWVLDVLIKESELLAQKKEAVTKHMKELNYIKQQINDASDMALKDVEEAKVLWMNTIQDDAKVYKYKIKQQRERQINQISAEYSKSEQYLQSSKSTEEILTQMIESKDDSMILKHFSTVGSNKEYSFYPSGMMTYETCSFSGRKETWKEFGYIKECENIINRDSWRFLGEININKLEYFNPDMIKDKEDDATEKRNASSESFTTSIFRFLRHLWDSW